jgi:hypothetical protein
MCTFLLKMREYFRWEQQIPLSHQLPKQAVGSWMAQREQAWDSLDADDYQPLDIQAETFDPFDNDAINKQLLQAGYVYNSGLGLFNKPHFFLGRLHDQFQRDGIHILISREELARDLVAPPAMTRDSTIFISRQSARRHIWEKIEEWQWRGAGESPLARALSEYGELDLTDPEQLLDVMTEQEVEAMILHELGENAAQRQLGAPWKVMVASLPHAAAVYARAVRDHLADCLVTLPVILENRLEPSLHFYFANFSGMRRTIFPSLLEAYHSFLQSTNYDDLMRAVANGQANWLDEANTLLQLFDKYDINSGEHIQRRYQTKYPL